MSNTDTYQTFDKWLDQQNQTLTICLYFEIVDWRSGGHGIDGLLKINPSGEFKLFPTFDNDTVYSTVADARLSANQYYAQELITFVPEFSIQDVKPLNWSSSIYTEMDATLEVESCEQGFKVVGGLQIYMDYGLNTKQIDSVNQGEKPYASIDEAQIAAKRFMRQLVVNNLIQRK